MRPTVSIIIPAYNVEKYIDKCIQSVVAQSYKEIQIILVNDGSKDSSGEIIKKYAGQDDRIVFIDKENAGVANARNDGVKIAIGEYLMFVDSDDYIGSSYVEDMVKVAVKNASELVISGYTLVREDEKKIKEIIPDSYVSGENEEWAYRICSTWGRLYRSSFWRKNKMRFEQEEGARAEDVPLAMYANVMANNICVVQNAEYFYRQHSSSAMHKDGGYFCFPYKAFAEIFEKVMNNSGTNSMEFFLLGTLKLFAYFEFVIYRNAGIKEKKRLREYVHVLMKQSKVSVCSVWKKKRISLKFPFHHKILMEILFVKYRGYREW